MYLAGPVSVALDGNAYAGTGDVFIAKYDSNGVKLWTREMGGSLSDYGWAAATDPEGNAVVAGSTANSLDGSGNAGAMDILVVKYDPSGARLWTREMGTTTFDQANAVATDPAGNVFVA